MHKAAKPKDLKALKRQIATFRSGFQNENPEYKSDQILLVLLLYLGIKYLQSQNSSNKWTQGPNTIDLSSNNVDTLFSQLTYIFEFVCSLSPHITKNKLETPTKEFFAICLPHLSSLDDVVSPLLKNNISIIGDIYQMWRVAERTISLDLIQKAAKTIAANDLISFTQIYTPDWIVDFLLSHTLGQKTNYYDSSNLIPITVSDTTSPDKFQNLTVLDPACGAGHFLIKAFNHLYSAYRSFNVPDKEAINLILKKQIHGIDVDNFALFIVSLILGILCIKYDVTPDFTLNNLCYLDLDETQYLGALTRSHKEHPILNSNFDVVVTNPPYIGRKLMARELKSALKKEYPDSYFDLSSAFVKRCLEFLAPEGRFGVITQASILTLPTYRNLRKHAINNYTIDLVVDLGPGAFPTQHGEKINSSLIVFSNPGLSKSKENITFIDLRKDKNKQEVLSLALDKLNKQSKNGNFPNGNTFSVSKDTISNIYNYAFNYQIPHALTKNIKESKTLSDVSEVKQGLATTDNKTFVKYIWEVNPNELNHKWYQYAKGAGSNRWFSPIIHVVDWYDNGAKIKQTVKDKYPYLNGKVNWVVKNEEYYFKNGLSFSFVSSNGMSVRKLPDNCIFDVGASSIFPETLNLDFLLSYLNSSIVNAFISSINPTINFQVGDLKRIPVIKIDSQIQNELSSLAIKCYQATKQLYDLSDPVSSYISIRHEDAINTAFSSWLTESLATDKLNSDNCVTIYSSKIEGLLERVKRLEKEVDEIVLAEFSKTFDWSSNEEEEVRNWTLEFQKPNTNKLGKDLKVAFESMLVTEKLLLQRAKNVVPQNFSNSAILLPSSNLEFLESYPRDKTNTDFKSFIGRSFRRVVPSDLLLEDIEVI